MTEGTRPGIRRRTVVAGVVAVVLPSAGCGIRLEDDAPRVPLVPTRTPVPAEAELVALTRDTAALAELAATVPGALAADLTTLHRQQHTVLRTTLLAAGVPAAALDATPSASPTSTASPTGTGSAGRSALAAAEGASAATAARFAGVAEDLRPTIASLHAQRYAAATLLAGRPPTVQRGEVGGEGPIHARRQTGQGCRVAGQRHQLGLGRYRGAGRHQRNGGCVVLEPDAAAGRHQDRAGQPRKSGPPGHAGAGSLRHGRIIARVRACSVLS